MKSIRGFDPVIDEHSPFKNCILGREKYADVLTGIVSNYADGFVLALNNKWGTGKTTFVKMWQQKLLQSNFETLYFNAWENDFEANPLVALMSELKGLVKPANNELYKGLVKKGAVVLKKALPHLAKSVAKKYLGEEAVAELVGDATEAATEIFSDEINDFTSKKQGLKDFREGLSEFVKSTAGDKPLIFIIDELDRCRPSYAVELLEQIKHFFSVAGIIFVLSIDKIQLGNAVRGFYGNDRIDADEYLMRFFDIEFSLPILDNQIYCKYLYKYFDFESFFVNPGRQHFELKEDGRQFIELATNLLADKKLTPRRYEKIFAHARVGLKSFKLEQYVVPRPYFLLTFIRIQHPELFQQIKNKEFSIQEFIDELGGILFKDTSIHDKLYYYDRTDFVHLEAQMVYMYYHSCVRGNRRILLFEKNSQTAEEVPTVKSAIDTSENQRHFADTLKAFSQGQRTYDIGIDYLIYKIDLLESMYS